MRVLGVDWGERRLGFAVSDPGGVLALPLKVQSVVNGAEAVAAVERILAETEALLVVVGLPLNMNGSRGEMAGKVDTFVAALREVLPVPVETWDERLSTGLVERTLLAADMSRKRRKEVRDKLAAQVILQGYLDSAGSGHVYEEPV